MRVAPGADRPAVLARLDAAFPYGVMDESLPKPPGPVVRLAQISHLAVALGVFMLALAAIALLHALVLLTRRRRGELAVLRAWASRPLRPG